jgi:SAM-dependent methyltransferase
VIHEHPLAYLLGVEGVALLRAFTGEYDREFVESRIAEVRRLLDDEVLADSAVDVDRVGTVDGYRVWSQTYDDGRNTAFDIDEPVIGDIVDAIPPGVALDAACGTGRWSRSLAARGHRVIGVDSSPDMLERARARVPEGDFRLGDLHRMPLADAEVDLIVCSLALTHVSVLDPVLAEFARVLRPGGHLVISDIHPEWVLRGGIPTLRSSDGRPGRLSTHRHLVGDYLRAALRAGLQLRRCEEPRPAPAAATDPPVAAARSRTLGPWELWPWVLADLAPEAVQAANAGVPAEIIWHFRATPAEAAAVGGGVVRAADSPQRS